MKDRKDDLLSETQAMEAYKCTHTQLWRLARSDKLTIFKVPNSSERFYVREELDRALGHYRDRHS